MKDIPFIAFEEAQARMERVNKRLWIVTILLIISLVASNGAWIYYESQWQVVQDTTTIEAEQGDGINIVGGGDVNYGTESKTDQNDQTENP